MPVQVNTTSGRKLRQLDEPDQPAPSPAEIRRRAEAIQAGWTPRERAKRLVCPPVPVIIPTVPSTVFWQR